MTDQLFMPRRVADFDRFLSESAGKGKQKRGAFVVLCRGCPPAVPSRLTSLASTGSSTRPVAQTFKLITNLHLPRSHLANTTNGKCLAADRIPQAT